MIAIFYNLITKAYLCHEKNTEMIKSATETHSIFSEKIPFKNPIFSKRWILLIFKNLKCLSA